ncbi:MAG: prevent-host-death protein [Hydrogenophilales bacterium 12-61-10]|nr:MAG: prevent-host-death protein [Hydrogenophilales bacterium 12-61-10]OYX29680.1 MAG: prevent-host-death protein [Hydrogenophilales bacterium 32-62-9]
MDLPATEFKAKCLAYLDLVARTRAEITLTKHGRAVARLVPVEAIEPVVFGRLAGTVQVRADIVHSIDEVWDADA